MSDKEREDFTSDRKEKKKTGEERREREASYSSQYIRVCRGEGFTRRDVISIAGKPANNQKKERQRRVAIRSREELLQSHRSNTSHPDVA